MIDWVLRRLADRTGGRARPGGRGDRPPAPLRAALVAGAHAARRARLRRPDPLALPPRGAGVDALQDGPGRARGSSWSLLAVFMLSEAVLSVERTGLPYFVVMVDDSASGQVVDQYANPQVRRRPSELAQKAGQRRADPAGGRAGLAGARRGAGPRRAPEAAQGPPLPRLDGRPAAGRGGQARGRRAGRREAAQGRGRPAGSRRLGDGGPPGPDRAARRPALGHRPAHRRPDHRRRGARQGGRVRRAQGGPALHRSAWATPSRPATWS